MSAKCSILVVEDDRVARELLEEILRGEGHDVTAYESGDQAIARTVLPNQAHDFDLCISDVNLGSGADGFAVLRAFAGTEIPVVLITAFGDVTGAMAAIQKGAYDYVSKPFNVDELVLTVSRALERSRLRDEKRAARAKSPNEKPPRLENIVGKSQRMLEVYKLVARVAASMSNVLVVGESGTGKELVARAIHTHSPRASGPFVAVNCTALTESLLESELFGHAKGAFTGAVTQKRGLFEEAQGGTIFLDELGDVSHKMQASLLRVLQEGEIRRVGANDSVKVDVRIVAATNKDLEEEVKAGRFREDLYFRINVVTIQLPPLRARPDDIASLTEHFLLKYATRESRADASIATEAMTLLTAYDWPGNVRELENVIERALALAKDGVILPSDLPPELQPPGISPRSAPTGIVDDRPTLGELERRYIELILKETGGNKKRAAEILGIDRRTLYRTLEREEREAKPDASDDDNGGAT